MGLGIRIVEQLVGSGLVKDVADLYTIKREDLLKLEGFAEKKADNLVEAIQASRQQPLARLINALGIRGVGEVMAVDLTRHFHNLDELSRVSESELRQIEGIGPNIASAIVDWFQRPGNQVSARKTHAGRSLADCIRNRPIGKRSAIRVDLCHHRYTANYVTR